MAKLPDNYIEILTYLRSHPDGLTTGQILDLAKKARYYAFQNSTQISSAIFYMRAKNLVTTFETKGGKNHKITEYGLINIDDEPIPDALDVIDSHTKYADKTTLDNQDCPKEAPNLPYSAPQKARNLLTEFDEHLHIVRTALIDELAEIKTPRIENKSLKLDVLKKLEPFYNSEISGVIAAIRNDLEQIN